MNKNALVALLAGTLFGLGLAISGMVLPERVLGFLDLFGHWDPTLAFVMGGGLLVTTPAFFLVLRRSRPLFDSKFYLPTRKDLDTPLLVGAASFGIGWGLAGLCPGPAIASLSTGSAPVFGFFAAMLAGMALSDRARPLFTRRPSATTRVTA